MAGLSRLDGDDDGVAVADMGAFEFLLATADSNGDGVPDDFAYEAGPRVFHAATTEALQKWRWYPARADGDADGEADGDRAHLEPTPADLGGSFAGTVVVDEGFPPRKGQDG